MNQKKKKKKKKTGADGNRTIVSEMSNNKVNNFSPIFSYKKKKKN